jgi:hypothetical protein
MPCNLGRKDLGCPFGCASVHRNSESLKRRDEYYKTPEGKLKKKELNRDRNKKKQDTSSILPEKRTHPIIFYLHFIMTQIEFTEISISEVQFKYQEYLKYLRQHSLAEVTKIEDIPDG